MNQNELKAVFDQQASVYDQQWLRMAPINECLYYLLESIFADLPSRARILCVGVGTGKELIHLAKKFPKWHFTAVEPSAAMLELCRHHANNEGISSRCYFHEGYLDSLPIKELHDGATCFLVSQFILEKETRSAFFQQIADQLKPGGILASADLSAKVETESYESLLPVWQSVMKPSDTSTEGLNRMRTNYEKNVAVLSPSEVASIINPGGFETGASRKRLGKGAE